MRVLKSRGISRSAPTTPSDVVTWNIEDVSEERSRKRRVLSQQILQELDADLFALQEISDVDAFEQMVDQMPGWEGYVGKRVVRRARLPLPKRRDRGGRELRNLHDGGVLDGVSQVTPGDGVSVSGTVNSW